jgi:predicted nuclease of restriction endonuclease-like (RecB) superfamily
MTSKRTPAPKVRKKAVQRVQRRVAPRNAASVSASFDEVVALIRESRARAFRNVNKTLIDLYWRVGGYVEKKIASDGWGKGTIVALSAHIQRAQPGVRGFSPQNLWRMRQFHETYGVNSKLSPLARVLPWTHNVAILGRVRSPQETEFYLRFAVREGWTRRELERQVRSGLFERSLTRPPKLSPVARELHPGAETVFRDSYMLEFLGLPEEHSEADLHSGLIRHLGRFINELGRDFAFIGSEYPVQVGGRDFALDLLFFHRGLNCLVAIELKVEEFQPEHLGKLQFYLEALDRDVRKQHERPSIGVLLCASKDNEVVEYALARSTSPALIAEYQRMLPNKALLRSKLHEFHALIEGRTSGDKKGTKGT